MNAPAAIEECQATDAPTSLAGLAGRATPLVIRGLCRDWPLVRHALASDTQFARHLAAHDSGAAVDALLLAPEADGCIGYNAAFDGFNFSHHRIDIRGGLQRLAQYSRQADAPGLAIQSALIAECLPGLLADHVLPGMPETVQPRIWIGNRVTTPAHFDEYHNLACVVCGRRRFTLFPPEQVANLYIGPLDFAPTGAAISVARLDRPDDPRYPRLREALAAAQVAELGPGDAIYIPPVWWHHVASLERLNALVNYWWQPRAGHGDRAHTALGCLLHCILALRSLPEAERAAWRGLLDHYVFAADEPLAHIPAARRGVLGALDAERIEALRERVRGYL